jgi:hypothetical protein
MRHIFRFTLLAGLIALGYRGWTVFFPNPQKVIRHRLLKLADLASFSPHEGNISRIASVEKLGQYFTEDAEVTVDVPGNEVRTVNGRAELTQAALAARSALSGLRAKFVDITIAMGTDRESATAHLTLMANVSGEKELVVQEMKFYFKDVKGDWLIHRIETIKTLR